MNLLPSNQNMDFQEMKITREYLTEFHEHYLSLSKSDATFSIFENIDSCIDSTLKKNLSSEATCLELVYSTL